MITDDVQIDRRILLEAESLFSQGNEVILLANWAEGLPLHEKIGNVKVERIIAHHSSTLCHLTIRINSLIIKGINWFSTKVQNIYSGTNSTINSVNVIFIKIINVFLNIISVILSVLFVSATTFGYILYLVFKYCAVVTLFKTIKFVILSVRKFATLLLYFQALMILCYNKIHSFTMNRFYFFCEMFSTINNLLIQCINFIFIGLRQVTKATYFLCNVTLVKCPAIITNKVSQFIYKYASKLSNRSKFLTLKATYFNPDIIHVHDLPRLQAGCLIKKALNIPLIYDAHELYPEIDTLTNKQKKKLKRLESKFIKQCDSVITVNEFIAEIMERDYKTSKINVIYNATTPLPTKLEKQPDLFRQNLTIPSNAHILLFQGWMSKTRGLQNLVRSIPQVEKKIHLVLMGYGDVQNELREIIAELRIKDRVHILEAVPQTELLKWTSSADAGIIPYQPIDLNNYYCSPNKLFEFIQAGLPIIANALPFLKKVVQENDFGLVADLKSPFEYAKAINLMFKNTNNFNRFKANLKKRSGEFSWASEEVKLKNIYQTALSRHLI